MCCLALTTFQTLALQKTLSQMYAEERNGSEWEQRIQQGAGTEKLQLVMLHLPHSKVRLTYLGPWKQRREQPGSTENKPVPWSHFTGFDPHNSPPSSVPQPPAMFLTADLDCLLSAIASWQARSLTASHCSLGASEPYISSLFHPRFPKNKKKISGR